MERTPARGGGMSIIWKDGNFLDGTVPQIFHDDGGFTNGFAVFDSMRAENGVLIDAREHFDRLVHDARVVLDIQEPWLPMFETMTNAWLPLLSQNKLMHDHARLRTVVTGGLSERPLSVSEIPSVVITAAKVAAPESLSPLTCVIVRDHPRIAGSALENCKRVDYSRALAARRIAAKAGADDAILMNTRGHIACGTTSNIFIEEKGVLITPPLSEGVLAGITRAKIIAERGAREDFITEERLRAAERIYLTNTMFGMRDVILK